MKKKVTSKNNTRQFMQVTLPPKKPWFRSELDAAHNLTHDILFCHVFPFLYKKCTIVKYYLASRAST